MSKKKIDRLLKRIIEVLTVVSLALAIAEKLQKIL